MKKNVHVSMKRQVTMQHIMQGDTAILKDWRPEWNFRITFEPGTWVVAKVHDTLIAYKGQETVLRSISGFCKVTIPSLQTPEEEGHDTMIDTFPVDEESCDTPPGENTSEQKGEEQHSDQDCCNELSMKGRPDCSCHKRYDLRPNPQPSQRLNDFVS
ncbi:hypothetical protein NDU88_004834 [Pleurodeles waltl]|uniref:Uncharacterized protein n=1 Tax=Pleurodeles waltl TaxID=8319 RepID=A0AAV7RHZ3_PLEWA|nr:hypothetical protein NDU88_004834 [Pleurodeles waltl]